MLVNGVPYRTIWRRHEGAIAFIDQNLLPHRFAIKEATSVEEMAEAIRHMSIRGAIALGAAAAYGLELAAHRAPDTELPAALHHAATLLKQTRPTAVNIAWATDSVLEATAEATTPQELRHLLRTAVDKLVNAEIERCRRIGEHGMHIIKSLAEKKEGAPVNILTHCNAGWLGCVDYGTALAPIYVAANNGIQLHVWVSETRPRNQGSALTAWELHQHGIPYSVVTDNACGHLIQRGLVDVAFVGADRITRRGDTANKIGTYLKALACHAHGVPFYVAAPTSSFDWSSHAKPGHIPIEERSSDEVHTATGIYQGTLITVRITPEGATAWNPSFDVTPVELLSGFITEHGVFPATIEGLEELAAYAHASS